MGTGCTVGFVMSIRSSARAALANRVSARRPIRAAKCRRILPVRNVNGCMARYSSVMGRDAKIEGLPGCIGGSGKYERSASEEGGGGRTRRGAICRVLRTGLLVESGDGLDGAILVQRHAERHLRRVGRSRRLPAGFDARGKRGRGGMRVLVRGQRIGKCNTKAGDHCLHRCRRRRLRGQNRRWFGRGRLLRLRFSCHLRLTATQQEWQKDDEVTTAYQCHPIIPDGSKCSRSCFHASYLFGGTCSGLHFHTARVAASTNER